MRCNIDKEVDVVGVYISPKSAAPEKGAGGERDHMSIIVGDLNARHKKWDNATNVRGITLVSHAVATNTVISAP